MSGIALRVPPSGIAIDGLSFRSGELVVEDPYWASALVRHGATILGLPDTADEGTVLSGMGPPTDGAGQVGDSYVDMTTGDVYRRE